MASDELSNAQQSSTNPTSGDGKRPRTAVVLSAVRADECKKYKRAYKRTGNPKYLDRYYACI